jgi:hypothetical protein
MQAIRVLEAEPKPRRRLLHLAPLGIGGLALAAMLFFDLGPPLAFNDDWGMAWGARQLMLHHQLRVFPVQSALALVQSVWSAVFTLGHPDQRLLRLSVAPFTLLAAYCLFRLSRLLGASSAWSVVAGITLLGTPLYLTGATSYMTDTVYVGLLLAVALTAARWIIQGKLTMAWSCVGWAMLCPLQRQLGTMVPIAITLGLLAAHRERRLRRAELYPIAALWVGVALTTLLPIWFQVTPPTQPNRVSAILHLSLLHQLIPILDLPIMFGVCLIPFAGALVWRRRAAAKPAGPMAWGWVALAGAGVAGCVVNLEVWGMIFPGNVFTQVGFTPTLSGHKVAAFPLPLFGVIEALALVTFLILLVHRRDAWGLRRLGAGRLFLVVLSASQFVPLLLLQTDVFDRYYLPIAAPIIPLAAVLAAATIRERLALGWAAGTMALGVVVYVIGQQDYAAWQFARDQAAQLAYAIVAPGQVDAGYEANATYVEVPVYDQTGQILGGMARSANEPDFAADGPPHPRLRLVFAPPEMPGPGVGYRSLAPGRIAVIGER